MWWSKSVVVVVAQVAIKPLFFALVELILSHYDAKKNCIHIQVLFLDFTSQIALRSYDLKKSH